MVNKLGVFEVSCLAMAIDCEGTMSIGYSRPDYYHKYGCYVPRVGFCNSSKELTVFVRDLIDSEVHIIETRNSPQGKVVYRIMLGSAEDIYALLSQIQPYIIAKKCQCELMLEFCELRLRGANDLTREGQIYDVMHELNTGKGKKRWLV